MKQVVPCLTASVFLWCMALSVLAEEPELSTTWEKPPVERDDQEAAGYAKILCSDLFITGRTFEQASAQDGFRVAPEERRAKLGQVYIDMTGRSVSVTEPSGVVRMAKLFGDQGCVILPKGEATVHFTPVPVKSALPDPQTQLWPMGDQLTDEPLPPEIDKDKLHEAVVKAFGRESKTLTAAFLVLYKGRIIAERYEDGADYHTRFPSWSMGKSINATLMGQLIQEGVYDLWSPAPVEEWNDPKDPRHAIRVADLLRMSSGLRFVSPDDPDFRWDNGYPDHLYIYTGAIDAFKWSITRPAQWLPDTVGRYRNSDPLTIAYLVRKAVEARGEEYLSYPQRHLFDKIGIRDLVLEPDPFGNFIISGYDQASARDWARLGLLYLQGGKWNGEQILPQGFTDFVRTPAPAWRGFDYGGSFWLAAGTDWPIPKDAYFMQGSGGQIAFIIPTHDLVVVRLGHDKGWRDGQNALHNALYPLLDAIPQVREEWHFPVPIPNGP